MKINFRLPVKLVGSLFPFYTHFAFLESCSKSIGCRQMIGVVVAVCPQNLWTQLNLKSCFLFHCTSLRERHVQFTCTWTRFLSFDIHVCVCAQTAYIKNHTSSFRLTFYFHLSVWTGCLLPINVASIATFDTNLVIFIIFSTHTQCVAQH